MKRGDIWLVNFDPSFGSEYQKIRPGLIVQSDDIKSSLITIIPFSSKVNKQRSDDIFVKKTLSNRLFSNSTLKVHQISSFDRERLIHYVGEVSSDVMSDTNIYLKKHFDLL